MTKRPENAILRPTVHTPFGIEVHCHGDEDSMHAAALLQERLPGATAHVGPQDESWSSVACRLDDKAIASVTWVRGAPRDLEQVAHQLAKACRVIEMPMVMDRKGAPRYTTEKTVMSEVALKRELGVDPDKRTWIGYGRNHRRRREGE